MINGNKYFKNFIQILGQDGMNATMAPPWVEYGIVYYIYIKHTMFKKPHQTK